MVRALRRISAGSWSSSLMSAREEAGMENRERHATETARPARSVPGRFAGGDFGVGGER
jgi:hypothetical protein